MSDTSLQLAHAAAQAARRLSHEYQRAHRNADPADASITKRGSELADLAAQATAKHDEVQRAVRASEAVRLRAQQQAKDAGLQAQLRADAQARRDSAATAGSPPTQRPRGRR